jgi:site-specific DNA recombinase
VHLLSGMVRCGTGHPPLSTWGNVAKGHTYYCCSYGRDYGKVAAGSIEGHGISCNVRESLLLPFIERFFAERLFGPMRLDLLAEQLGRVPAASTDPEAKELRKNIAAADRDLAACRAALSAGIDSGAVQARIDQLEADRGHSLASLAALPTSDDRYGEVGAALHRLPDLSDALRDAPPETKRLFFDAFDLRVIFDKAEGRLQISATITEALADLLQEPRDLALCVRPLRGWDSNPQPTG